MSENKQAYISHVHLKGYKSIRDMEVDLLPGLNIIIGPNGSGKTNFLEFLDTSMNRISFNEEIYTEINCITERNNLAVSIKHYFKPSKKDKFFSEAKLIYEQKELYNNKLVFHQKVPISKNKGENLPAIFREGEFSSTPAFFYFPQKINYGLPDTETYKYGLTFPARIQIFQSGKIIIPEFENNPSWLFSVLIQFNESNFKTTNNIISQVNIELLRENLSLFTPINNIAFDEIRYRQYEEKGNFDNESIFIVDGIYFKFYVNDKWLHWEQLSDGTKRLFWMIAVVLYGKTFIFLEEPELGIHPDQLYKLMDFLKEQSKEKQIIITTHSPEVLNILGKDELDRIIVTRYDSEKGTQMHKLSPHHIRKGQIYMKEVGYLSNFWVHSNLEEYEAQDAE